MSDITPSKELPVETRPKASLSRRGFFSQLGGFGAAGVLPAATLFINTDLAKAATDPATVTSGDIAILKFLAAAELLETDLWGQYSELAYSNPRFRRALEAVDKSMPDYIFGDFDDERSHGLLINGFLTSIGQQAVNLDPFRTLPSSPASGAQQIGRLTSLRTLTVDTSWYNRYRTDSNPDFGDSSPQAVNITARPTIPLTDRMTDDEALALAQTAAFHFAAIEQGGSSLYGSLYGKVTNLDVLSILTSIGPTEVYHFGVFNATLANIKKLRGRSNNVVFPDISKMTGRGLVMPKPCSFLDETLPLCSVIRPSKTANAGAVAAATGLLNSGLFTGQSQAFIDAAVGLAIAADGASRQMTA